MNNRVRHPIPQRLLLLLLPLLLLAGCSRGSARGTPTPLPPEVRVEQPTPDFGTVQPLPTPPATPTPETNPAALTIQQILATKRAELATATPTPARRQGQPPVLVLPTVLGIVDRGSALFYATPGGAVLATLPPGTTLTVTGKSEDGAWLAAYTDDGQAGWVAASQVRLFGDEETLVAVTESQSPSLVATLVAEARLPVGPIPVTPLAPEEPTPGAATSTPPPGSVPATVQAQGINVRAGPGTDFPVVGGLGQGAQVRVLGRNEAGDWLQIQLPGGGRGWVFAPLLSLSGDVEALPVAGFDNPDSFP